MSSRPKVQRGEQQSLGDPHGLGQPSSREGRWFDRFEQTIALFQPKPNPFVSGRRGGQVSRERHAETRRLWQFALDPNGRKRVLTDRYRPPAISSERKASKPDRRRTSGVEQRQRISVEHRPSSDLPASFRVRRAHAQATDKSLLKSPGQRLFLTPVRIGGQQLIEARAPLGSGAERCSGWPRKTYRAQDAAGSPALRCGADRIERQAGAATLRQVPQLLVPHLLPLAEAKDAT